MRCTRRYRREAEANEWFVEEFDTAGEGGDVANPNIVHGMRRGRSERSSTRRLECHAAAEVEIAHKEVVPPPFVETGVRKEGGGGDIEGIVCAWQSLTTQFGAGFEHRDHALHLAFEPQIVLIGEENVFSSRLLEGMFKILDGRPVRGP